MELKEQIVRDLLHIRAVFFRPEEPFTRGPPPTLSGTDIWQKRKNCACQRFSEALFAAKIPHRISSIEQELEQVFKLTQPGEEDLPLCLLRDKSKLNQARV